MYKSFVQMERSNAAKNMDAPNKQLSAQSMVTKANPQEVNPTVGRKHSLCVAVPNGGADFFLARAGFRKIEFTMPRGGSEVNKTPK